MPSITLVQYPGLTPDTTVSPPCAKVHMALRFKGLDYSIRNATSMSDAKKANPRGRMPALIVDAETIVDSSDILTELERRFPEPPLEPDDSRDRARARILEDWADETLYFQALYLRWAVDGNYERLRHHFFGGLPAPARWFVPPLVRREMVARVRRQGTGLKDEEVVRRELDECLDAVVALVGDDPFLLGYELTRADLAVASLIDQLLVEPLNPRAAESVRSRAAIMGWLERVHERAPSAASISSPG